MDIVITGAGEVGTHAAEVMAQAGHAVTIIDIEADKLSSISEMHDVRTLLGSGTHAEVLREAGAEDADLFIAATNIDELNLLSCKIAKAVGTARCIARVHHAAYFEGRGLDYGEALGIDDLVCPEYSTAAAIVQALRSAGVVAIEQFARGKIDVRQIKVSPDAPATRQALADLRLPVSARVALVSGDKGAYIPGAQTVVAPGDTVMLIANAADIARAESQFVTQAPHRESVVVVGGTAQGVWMCRALRSKMFSVRLLEDHLERAEELAAKLDWVTVLRADPADPATYEQERLDRADAFIAVTENDESNILSAARAKRLGVGCAAVVLQRPTYLRLLPDVGVDYAFCPRDVAVDHIMNLIQAGPVRQIAVLAPGVAVMYAVRLPAQASPLMNRPLREVRFPERIIVAAVQRGDHVYVPGPDNTLEPGDDVILVGAPSIRKQLRSVFGL